MWSQFGNFAQNTLQNLDYETLSRFKNYNVSIGKVKNYITYLRTFYFYNKEFSASPGGWKTLHGFLD
jgi:hypothetical protein